MPNFNNQQNGMSQLDDSVRRRQQSQIPLGQMIKRAPDGGGGLMSEPAYPNRDGVAGAKVIPGKGWGPDGMSDNPFIGGGSVPPQMGEGGGNMAIPRPGGDNLAVQGITSGAGGKPTATRNPMTAGPGRGMMPFPGRGGVPPTPVSGGGGAPPLGGTPTGGGGSVPTRPPAVRPNVPLPRPGGQVGGNAGGAGGI